MRTRTLVALATATTLFGGSTTLLAQQATTPQTQPAKPAKPATSANEAAKASGLARTDRNFITDVARDSMAEVELGRLAAERGQSDQVKQFGQRMVTDHTKASDELKKLADQKGVTLPTELDRSHARTLDRLAKLSGTEFDKAFVTDMVKDHKKAVKEFQKQSEKAKDADLKSWAGQTLPTLQDHLKAAQDMQASVAKK
jgi:putative membrane protein